MLIECFDWLRAAALSVWFAIKSISPSVCSSVLSLSPTPHTFVCVCVCKCNNFRNQNKTVTHDCRFVTNKLNFPISIFLHALLCVHVYLLGCARLVVFGAQRLVAWPFWWCACHGECICHWVYTIAWHSPPSLRRMCSVHHWQFATKLFLHLIGPRHTADHSKIHALRRISSLWSRIVWLHFTFRGPTQKRAAALFRLWLALSIVKFYCAGVPSSNQQTT